jgi:hypothetical protein
MKQSDAETNVPTSEEKLEKSDFARKRPTRETVRPEEMSEDLKKFRRLLYNELVRNIIFLNLAFSSAARAVSYVALTESLISMVHERKWVILTGQRWTARS